MKTFFSANTSEKEDAVSSRKKYGKEKSKKTINLTKLEPEEKLKYEIAEELGHFRSRDAGWVEVINIKRDRTDWRNGHRKKTRDEKNRQKLRMKMMKDKQK